MDKGTQTALDQVTNRSFGCGCFAWIFVGMLIWLPGFGAAIVALVDRLAR